VEEDREESLDFSEILDITPGGLQKRNHRNNVVLDLAEDQI
jgi:hypothetical protein